MAVQFHTLSCEQEPCLRNSLSNFIPKCPGPWDVLPCVVWLEVTDITPGQAVLHGKGGSVPRDYVMFCETPTLMTEG